MRWDMKNKNRIYAALNAAMYIGLICYAVYLLSDSPTIQKITSENGYTIINQEPFDIRLSIPTDIISEDAYTLDGQTFEPSEITVFEYADSSIYLNQIMSPKDEDGILQFDFECAYDLEYNGEIILPYWVREDGKICWDVFLEPQLEIESQPDTYTLFLHKYGPLTEFSLFIDEDLCKQDGSKIEIPVCANMLMYMKGEKELSPNSEPMSEEKIVRTLKSYRTSDIEIIDVVRTPESELGIIGVVAFREKNSEDVYAIAFVRKDDHPRELFYSEGDYPFTMHDLEYSGKDTVTYFVEYEKDDCKEIIKYSLTLEVNDKNETNFVHDIIERRID